MAALEQTMLRPLVPRKGGRPKKSSTDVRQMTIVSIA